MTLPCGFGMEPGGPLRVELPARVVQHVVQHVNNVS